MNEMSIFLRVIEAGSFAGAAEGLGMTPSGVSRAVSRIEDRLRVRLLTRSTRRLALTDEGRRYLDHCRDILAAIETAEADISARATAPHGVLRINTGTTWGKYVLGPILPEFLARYPEISVELSITDRLIDPLAERADITIRNGEISTGSLRAEPLHEGRRIICASPAYLARHGTPRAPADLAQHNCLLVAGQSASARWPFATPEGVERQRVRGNFQCDNAVLLLDLALAGHGIVRLGDILVARAIRAGQLVALLEDHHTAEPYRVTALLPPGRFVQPKVRAFLSFLRARADPAALGDAHLTTAHSPRPGPPPEGS